MFNVEKILFEDQKYLSGVDSYVDWMKRTAPVQMSLTDILNMNKRDSDNMPDVYPYNVDTIENFIKKELDDLQTLLAELQTIKKNPVIKCSKMKVHIVKKLEKKVENSIKVYFSMLDDIKYLTIDNK